MQRPIWAPREADVAPSNNIDAANSATGWTSRGGRVAAPKGGRLPLQSAGFEPAGPASAPHLDTPVADLDTPRAVDDPVPLGHAGDEHRAFLRRAVAHLAYLGVRQFLDLGSAPPTGHEGVHVIARQAHRDSRAVYLVSDPASLLRHQAALAGERSAAAVTGDPRDPAAVIADPRVAAVLDGSRPIAVLLVAVLDDLCDDESVQLLLGRLHACLPSGSYVVVSHATADGAGSASGAPTVAGAHPVGLRGAGLHAAGPHPASPGSTLGHPAGRNPTGPGRGGRPVARSKAELVKLFDRFHLLAPGIVRLPGWRPDFDSRRPAGIEDYPGYGAVLHRP